jgi:hypothetical protein
MRAADAMLRALGGEEITLVLPLPTETSDLSYQIGLSDPGVQQLLLSPVVVRKLPAPASGPAQRVEFLLSASAVASTVDSQGLPSAQALFDAALGVHYQGELFHIESATTDYFAGIAYLHRVVAVE